MPATCYLLLLAGVDASLRNRHDNTNRYAAYGYLTNGLGRKHRMGMAPNLGKG
jgi:hypothetical protein